jgi:hypothetical protein
VSNLTYSPHSLATFDTKLYFLQNLIF